MIRVPERGAHGTKGPFRNVWAVTVIAPSWVAWPSPMDELGQMPVTGSQGKNVTFADASASKVGTSVRASPVITAASNPETAATTAAQRFALQPTGNFIKHI